MMFLFSSLINEIKVESDEFRDIGIVLGDMKHSNHLLKIRPGQKGPKKAKMVLCSVSYLYLVLLLLVLEIRNLSIV